MPSDRTRSSSVTRFRRARTRPASTPIRRIEKPGWWDGLIGYGKGIDLGTHFVICANFPGSCFGTTAPGSIDPATGKPYGSRYPWPTIEDMVHSQKLVLDHLGIDASAGGRRRLARRDAGADVVRALSRR